MRPALGGIDPHQDSITVGIIDLNRVELTHQTFPTSSAGYRRDPTRRTPSTQTTPRQPRHPPHVERRNATPRTPHQHPGLTRERLTCDHHRRA
jgi:hypothetical protein